MECFDQVADDFHASGRIGRPGMWPRNRRHMAARVRHWLESDSETISGRRARPVSSELRFGRDASPAAELELTDGRVIRLHGVIDRVDLGADGTVYVTDHKTGNPNYAARPTVEDPTQGGSKLQLPVYAAAACAHLGLPSDAPVYSEYSLLDSLKSPQERRGYRTDAATRERIASDFTVIVEGIEAGLFPLHPDPPSAQRPFNTCWYCDPDFRGTADRFQEWTTKASDVRLAPYLALIGADGADVGESGGPQPEVGDD